MTTEVIEAEAHEVDAAEPTHAEVQPETEEPSASEVLITDLMAYHADQGGWGALSAAMGGNDIHNNGLVSCRTAARVAKDEAAQGLITRLLALREVPRRQLRRDVRERLV